MKKIIFLTFFLCTTLAYTQKNSLFWNIRIDSLRYIYEQTLLSSESFSSNYSQDSLIIKIIVRMLRDDNSYKQKWDSLSGFLTCMIAPDNKFRVITWKIPIPSASNLFSYRGIIQMNDKTNTLIPLFDGYVFSQNRYRADGYDNHKNWFGATYYAIFQLEKNEPTYTLFGLRQDDVFSDKKIIETFSLNKDKSISFGGAFHLNGIDTNIYTNNNERFIFAFKKGISTTFLYEKDLKRIVFDQLTSISNSLMGQNKLISGISGINNIFVPDGHYLGLKYQGNGTWFFVGDVLNLLKKKN
ncbi:MAG: hypothetical protein ACRCR9_05265 [Chitinophagaceae bacterium]